MDLEIAVKYFGVDWVAMLFTFVAIYYLGNKSRAGFLLMICGNTCWVVVGVLTASVAMVLANVVFLVMNARGWFRWSNEPAP